MLLFYVICLCVCLCDGREWGFHKQNIYSLSGTTIDYGKLLEIKSRYVKVCKVHTMQS